MLHIQCLTCGTAAFADCSCPDGWEPMIHGHITPEVAAMAAQAGMTVEPCAFANPDAMVTCPAGGPCCQQDHDHAAAANACPGGHDCGLGVDGCTVCRPLTITVVPGSTQVQPVAALRAVLGG